MLESSLERAICNIVKKYGGRAYKWVSPGCSGVPDRLCVFSGGRVVFVEIKRPGLQNGSSARQEKVQRDLAELGCVVWVINDKKQFEEKLTAILGRESNDI